MILVAAVGIRIGPPQSLAPLFLSAQFQILIIDAAKIQRVHAPPVTKVGVGGRVTKRIELPSNDRRDVQGASQKIVPRARLIDHAHVMRCRFVVHGPTAVDEAELGWIVVVVVNQTPQRRSLFDAGRGGPPRVQKFGFHVGKGPGIVLEQRREGGGKDASDKSALVDGSVATVVILIDRLAPTHVVVRVRYHVNIEHGGVVRGGKFANGSAAGGAAGGGILWLPKRLPEEGGVRC
mmetsp:Transcript_5465/g.15417  ORF Transcript_5465/g.15417 Transcript_5465/m.15417 type:complete len:235 (-) Transcript_5465:156-860(-)